MYICNLHVRDMTLSVLQLVKIKDNPGHECAYDHNKEHMFTIRVYINLVSSKLFRKYSKGV